MRFIKMQFLLLLPVAAATSSNVANYSCQSVAIVSPFIIPTNQRVEGCYNLVPTEHGHM